MDFGFLKKISTRTEAVEEVLQMPKINEEDFETVNTGYHYQNMIKFGFRCSLLPFFYLLYRNKFFERKAPFMIKEIGLVAGGVAYFSLVDYGASELMWRHCGDVVRRYVNYTDQFYIDKSTLEEMKKMYEHKERGKRQLSSLDSEKIDADEEDL